MINLKLDGFVGGLTSIPTELVNFIYCATLDLK